MSWGKCHDIMRMNAAIPQTAAAQSHKLTHCGDIPHIHKTDEYTTHDRWRADVWA